MKFIASLFRYWIGFFSRRKALSPKKRLAKDLFGEEGEKRAAKFLKSMGYKIIARNVQFSIGEIDLIARIDKTIVFVEVKTRHVADFCHPREVVDKKKCLKIKQMAKLYYRNKKYSIKRFVIRFDIITLIWPEGKPPKIEHFVDAFR